MPKISPCLWFDNEAEDAANYYVGIFSEAPNGNTDSRVMNISRYDAASAKASGQPEGSVMVVNFKLGDLEFAALNGGKPSGDFVFNSAVSFMIMCSSQEEVDHYWDRLTEGGKPSQCGWLADKYGVAWQVVPEELDRLLTDPDPAKAARAMEAMLEMTKIDIAEIRRAHAGS